MRSKRKARSRDGNTVSVTPARLAASVHSTAMLSSPLTNTLRIILTRDASPTASEKTSALGKYSARKAASAAARRPPTSIAVPCRRSRTGAITATST